MKRALILGEIGGVRMSGFQDSIDSARRDGAYIEGVILMHQWLEILLRHYVRSKGVAKHYWYRANIRFASLIDYCELLGMKKECVDTLREFNKLRNDIAHSSFTLIEEEIVSPTDLLSGQVNLMTMPRANRAKLDQQAFDAFFLGLSFWEYDGPFDEVEPLHLSS